ncbi:rCG20350 [Rattus norvegicus]|uniref:RCG20350 n=1 Tax=Rattus norvegicus TaxID=10116 RepID=A6JGZ3_RAT|nr:rCG20350 [Rattus norvegicus]
MGRHGVVSARGDHEAEHPGWCWAQLLASSANNSSLAVLAAGFPYQRKVLWPCISGCSPGEVKTTVAGQEAEISSLCMKTMKGGHRLIQWGI